MRKPPPGHALDRQALPTIPGKSSKSRIEPRLSDAAASLTGTDVRVACWSVDKWHAILGELAAYYDDETYLDLAGFADFPSFRVSLAPSICSDLVMLAYPRTRPHDDEASLEAAKAIVVLTHESIHFTSAGGNEALVECRAMQLARDTALALGLSEAYADSVPRRYWIEVYPYLSEEYRSGECRSGGSLDLDGASSRWP